jgi:elongator complex protein 1
LYKEALDVYKYQLEQLRDMTNIYANYLHDRSKYKEAAIGKLPAHTASHQDGHLMLMPIAYESLALYEDAYKCYHLAHCWRESLYCALMVPLSEAGLAAHAHTLANTLIEESRDYVSAAHIHAEHLHDIPAAARLLCRGSQFADATRLLALNGKQALIADIVDTGLAEAMGSTTDLLADFRSQLNAQVPRISELRARRAADPLAFFGGDPSSTADAAGVDIPDNVSLAPTEASTLAGRSMFTRYTGRTGASRQSSKTRRREERKRAVGKKGTVYEEEYLVNSVRRLLERANSAISEVEGLVDALLRRGMRERAAAIERTLQEVLNLCSVCREEVFDTTPAATAAANGANGDQGPDAQAEDESLRPRGGESVFFESVASTFGGGAGSREVPLVKEMRKSALLS